MDKGCYLYALNVVNMHKPFPYETIKGLGKEEHNKLKDKQPFNILKLMAAEPDEIIIQLVEGGQVTLKKTVARSSAVVI